MTLNEIKEQLAQIESEISEWRDENPQHTTETISVNEAHRHISEALTYLGR